MKAEERKELETNALADKMGRIVQNVKSGPNRRSVLWVVLVVAAAVVVFLYVRHRRTRESEQARYWFFLGMVRMASIEQQRLGLLSEVANMEKDLTPVTGARMEETWLYLHNSSLELRRDPMQALRTLSVVHKRLTDLQKPLKDNPVVLAEALYHQAVIQETRSILDDDSIKDLKLPKVWEAFDPENTRGSFLQSAKDLYLEVRDKHKDTPYAEMASKRLESLETDKGMDAVRATYRNLIININLEEALREREFRFRAEALKKKDLPDIE